ncbi:molybdopterin molybdotransferase MoeA [Parasphingorhabdus cellanae]|uniref:Molybdopterin molybdenumtransferase n=1 Tax=Parasphingorhabdus cellanae TaxID=2806553 RepID=A0ABX7T815_9SPHN|nr:gephyrin-like molybdotransferase Glp [Parasphingorhabdus cellanae]QTD56083.1 molybdopterin molybdotransferase MoeA [Parasphingorhabdus cellanae]
MKPLLPLEEAQKRLIAMAQRSPSETIPVGEANGRYLAEDLIAKRSQPAADMSAMDGYAIAFDDRAGPWQLVGECKAGSPPCPPIQAGQAARIFTGALLPEGADTVVMQENVKSDGAKIQLIDDPSPVKGRHVRHAGGDFKAGDVALKAGLQLNPAALGHAVIAGAGHLSVGGTPKIAVLSTGDELVAPGDDTEAHQIPASNDVMIAAMLDQLPAKSRSISRIKDDMDSLCAALESAEDCDIIVTIGGASVGDHDLVAPAFNRLGGHTDFWKIAMKPGKPLMAGKLGSSLVVALPGNPGSAFVTATLFLVPLIRYLAGAEDYMPVMQSATSSSMLPATSQRAEFLRAKVDGSGITAFDSQDSAKLSILAAANALLYRPAHSPEQQKGAEVSYIAI